MSADEGPHAGPAGEGRPPESAGAESPPARLSASGGPGLWLRAVDVDADGFPRRDCYPYDLPWLGDGCRLELRGSVTFFVGENGAGKSTLLEAIARRGGTHLWHRSKKHIAHHNPHETALADYLKLEWAADSVPGGFFSAETFRDRADFLDDVSLVDPGQMKYYGGRTLTDQSHGEGLLTYFAGRYRYRGIYYIDEPESALSPRSQVAFLRLLSEYSSGGHAQFLIATHSPILMALPGAQILLFSRDEVREVAYQETDHYRLYREFVLDPEAFLDARQG